MGDAVGSMINSRYEREREREREKALAENLPVVTALIRRNNFPGYIVTKCKLQMNGGLYWGEGHEFFSGAQVFKILPQEAFHSEMKRLNAIKEEYKDSEFKLRTKILDSYGINIPPSRKEEV